MTDFVFARIHGMPCVNKCWHCFCEGSPQGRFMETDDCLFVLDELAELKARLGTVVFPMFFDEPTIHPSFKQIMKHQLSKGLIYDDWWFSTNGYGLARMSDADWKELADSGFDYIRLAFHGTGEKHDDLVGRRGAYEDLLTTIHKAEKHNVSWLAGMYLNSENQTTYEETRDAVSSLGTPCTEFGWMLPQSQGRVLEKDNRVTSNQISRLLIDKHGWVSESEFTEKILTNADFGQRTARDTKCGIVYLDIDEDLNVFFGGGCDGDPFGFMKDRMLLGNLRKQDIHACYQKYLNNPPEPLGVLNELTWRELALKYGNQSNDQVFYYLDLIGRKWSEAYLRDFYSGEN